MRLSGHCVKSKNKCGIIENVKPKRQRRSQEAFSVQVQFGFMSVFICHTGLLILFISRVPNSRTNFLLLEDINSYCIKNLRRHCVLVLAQMI